MRHGSLFSGIGGFDLAATWMGWENVFQCEIDPFNQRILRFYWPQTVLYADIRKFEARDYCGTIDVLSGGFPCQPFSVGGKRRGTADRRHLWPEMYRVIREIRPRWVVGENVLGLLNWNHGLVFEQVQVDLEAAGYETWSYILPAAGVGGAPHRRDRIWFVAYAGSDRSGRISSLAKNGNDEVSKGADGIADLAPIFTDLPASSGKIGAVFGNRMEGLFGSGAGNDLQYPGIPNWEGFPVESPFCVGDDGFSGRLDGITLSSWRRQSIRGAGNAVVPELVLRIFRVIGMMEGAGDD